MLLSLISFRTAPTVVSVLLLCLVVSVIGVLDELTQRLVGRTASFTDLAADVIGMLSALVVYTVMVCVDESDEQATDRSPHGRSFGSVNASFATASKPERRTSGPHT
ncbi:MAG: VanZ family protein, partial [Planctomycetota bacterium]